MEYSWETTSLWRSKIKNHQIPKYFWLAWTAGLLQTTLHVENHARAGRIGMAEVSQSWKTKESAEVLKKY